MGILALLLIEPALKDALRNLLIALVPKLSAVLPVESADIPVDREPELPEDKIVSRLAKLLEKSRHSISRDNANRSVKGTTAAVWKPFGTFVAL